MRRASALFAVCLSLLAFASASARAQEPETRVGYSSDAMPGFARVGVPRVDAWTASVAGALGYGYTEDVLQQEDSHSRLSGRLAGAIKLIPYLTLALRLDGRYDSHSIGDESDDGLVGDPRFSVRGAYELDSGLMVGGQLTAWFPGEDAPSIVFDAISFDALGMIGYRAGALTLALNAGFRLDQSDGTAAAANRLSASDRLSLGVSDWNAILLGVGASYALGAVDIFGEWTWDLLVGSNAPDASLSPMRATIGGRLFALDQNALQVELGIDLGLSSRPEGDVLERADVLFPVEPRFGAHVALAFRFPAPERPIVTPPDGGDDVEPPPDVPPAVTTGVLEGTVTDEQGQPVANASVTVGAPAAADAPAEPPVEGEPTDAAAAPTAPSTTTDAQGHFRLADLPAGSVTITVHLDGYRDGTATATVVAGQTAQANVSLVADLPQGQLRGVVQSFRGAPLAATIRVEPLGVEATADAEGVFEIDVPPGTYQVRITSNGYTEQTRTVTVEERGVTVLNVDMRRGN